MCDCGVCIACVFDIMWLGGGLGWVVVMVVVVCIVCVLLVWDCECVVDVDEYDECAGEVNVRTTMLV